MTTHELTALAECYPDGVPDGFPVELFAPQDSSMVFTEHKLQQKLDKLQADMGTLPQLDLPIRNVFAGGCYARELFIPKGTVLIGKLHLTDHINICTEGDLTFLTTEGPKRVKAPAMFAAPAGTKKLAYANEDTRWINIHQAIHDDPEFIVAALTVDTYAEYEKLVSYNSMLIEVDKFGFDEEQMHLLSVDPETLDDSPIDGVEVLESTIHGLGLFATKEFAAGDSICVGTLNGKRSLAGRYSNHHHTPNCVFKYDDGVLYLTALEDITAGDELTTNYGATLHSVLGARSET
jgi:hypothetical protein